jgi:hypothetical protein
MPGLVPGIHVLKKGNEEDVDGRDKPSPDEGVLPARRAAAWQAINQP